MIKNIDRWMLLLLALLLTACQGSDEDNSSSDDCYLDIYVYAPDRPIVTRSDVGEIPPSNDAEKKVNTLQVWVFKSNGGAKVGYLNDTKPTYLNETNQQKYRMKVTKDFADRPEPVDVYVVANAASCGLTTLDENATPTVLDEAKIGSSSFGVSSNYSDPVVVKTPPEVGLPMSAVEKNQSIYGSFPSLRIGKEDEMTTLQLTRAVSKLRFVFCRINDDNSSKKLVSIDDISLSGGQIPDGSWLVPKAKEETKYTTYDNSPISYGGLRRDDIHVVADPLTYLYETQTAKDYEDMIDDAVKDNKLTQKGLTYLRESDKQLTGSITYTYSENGVKQDPVPISFSMAAPGDFLRNHSWIIYVYYMDTKIHVQVVTHIGMKKWYVDTSKDENMNVHNW